jgi:hypothetical protein
MYSYALSSTTGQAVWKKKLNGESNRGNHPVVMTASNTVLFHSVQRFGGTGLGHKDRYVVYGLQEGEPATAPLASLLTSYQSGVLANPETKSMFLFNIDSGTEVTSFSSGSSTYQMIPMNMWYMNSQYQPLVMNNKDLVLGAFGGYIKLDTVTNQFSVIANYQHIRGDEYTGMTISDGYLYGGYMTNIGRMNLSTAANTFFHGCLDCGAPGTRDGYNFFDDALSQYHWRGYGGNGYTNYGSFPIIANGRMFYSSNGWFYVF